MRPPPALARAWTRLLHRLGPQRLEIFFAPEYQTAVGGTPIDPYRAERVLTYLFSRGLIGRKSPSRPDQISLEQLLRVHDEEYLYQLQRPESLLPIIGFEVSEEVHHRLLEAQRFALGGTVLATKTALDNGKMVFNLGGGFHHASPGAGRGFCVFNDIAVAISEVRDQGFRGPVLVIDLDLHDGDGTRAAFARDSSVFTLSIHNQTWDTEPAESDLSIELSGEVEDRQYLAIVEENVSHLLPEVSPDLIFFVAGTDPAYDDRLGNWKISAQGMLHRDRFVLDAIAEHTPAAATVLVLGGGYGHRTWRYTATTLAWLLAGWTEPDLPSNEELAVSRYRSLLGFPDGGQRRDASRAEQSHNEWQLTEEDIYGELGSSRRRTRLLDVFSPHGIELVIERSGLLQLLRDAGYPKPTLAFDLEGEGAQTVQVFTDPERTARLIELRVSRDRRTIPEMELLVLEWLLLQNPKGEFRPLRPQLPGQKHPSLGVLSEVMALLVLFCEQLNLDGISFVPSHFHLAIKGKKFLRFVEPKDEAWFRALRTAVAALPLQEATQAISDGRVIDSNGASVRWRPMLMVLPVSERLHARVESDSYEEIVAGQTEEYEFSLA